MTNFINALGVFGLYGTPLAWVKNPERIEPKKIRLGTGWVINRLVNSAKEHNLFEMLKWLSRYN